MKYSEIYNIEDPKQKLFSCMYRITQLIDIKSLFGLTDSEELELKNLETLKMNAYSEWKD